MKNKEKFMESVGWAVNTDCEEVKVLKEHFIKYVSVCASVPAAILMPDRARC